MSNFATPENSNRQLQISRSDISEVALRLFLERGFDETTMGEVAAAAGISRRTLFRYFASKNDLPWGDFEDGLQRMHQFLQAVSQDAPLMQSLRDAVIDFNRFPEEVIETHRERMELLLHVPSLVAHSMLRYEAWRQVIAEFIAERLGVDKDSIEPQSIAWACLGASLSAYEYWLHNAESDLAEVIRASFDSYQHHFRDAG